MKILFLSDIHSNVSSVVKMRSQETNVFDAVVVAGDIGAAGAQEIFSILSSFACPVMYVFGNWDHELSYDAIFGRHCHHLHLRPFYIGEWVFAGFSGCPTHWGRNPINEQMRHQGRRGSEVSEKEIQRKILRLNRTALAKVLQDNDGFAHKIVIVTHERLSKTKIDLPNISLFAFGHRHRFQHTIFRGSNYLNIPPLDARVSVIPKSRVAKSSCALLDGQRSSIMTYHMDAIPPDYVRNINCGGYVIMDWTKSRGPNIKCIKLDATYAEWEPLKDDVYMKASFLP